MQRRHHLHILAATGLPVLWGSALPALAHHGWGSFDSGRPIYLAGRVERARWSNPHVELVLACDDPLRVPANLAQRPVPSQRAAVDGAAVLARAVVPTRRERVWEVELAPLFRMQSWGVEAIAAGARVEVVGYTFPQERGEAILRAEYLFIDGKAYGLRSNPA